MTSATLPRVGEDGGQRRDEIRARALAVAKAVASAPLALLAAVWLVLLPAAVAIKAWDLAVESGSVLLQVIVVSLMAAATAGVFWWSVGRRGIKSLLWLGRFQPTLSAVALAGFAMVTFTAGTALLFERGLVGITPAPARDEVLDQAALRLERLAARSTASRPHGYLLVVDAIAEGARERLELALERAPFPAALVVWRGDQRAEDLTAAFDALEERVTAPAPSPALPRLPLPSAGS
jgi:hypothetical protein